MNFGNILRDFDQRGLFIRAYFIIGTLFILGLFFFYIIGFQQQATKEARIVPNLVSQFMYYSGSENFESILTLYILQEIVGKIDYPIIITDRQLQPVFWKNIGIDETNWNDLQPAQQTTIINRVEKLRKDGYIIPLIHTDERATPLGWTFYEDSKVIKRLKIMPYVEMVSILIFIVFGLYALSLIKRNEKRKIWIGLAKETAHQFGTPISSLIGWIDLLKMKAEKSSHKDEIVPMLDDMASDIYLLKKVASRFGKVGSTIKLQEVNIDTMISQCIDYFQKRLPHFGNEINIKYIAECPNVKKMLDEELFTWALENIIKNSIDAMSRRKGNITITTHCGGDKFFIRISDMGVGMTKSMYKKIFEPGITTKERGWGLGLSLTKRIIEEYHQGKVRVLESTVDVGTTFEIEMINQ